MPYENEKRVADVDAESLLCWESEGISYPRRQLICTPVPSRRCLILWSFVGLKYEPYFESPSPRAHSRI